MSTAIRRRRRKRREPRPNLSSKLFLLNQLRHGVLLLCQDDYCVPFHLVNYLMTFWARKALQEACAYDREPRVSLEHFLVVLGLKDQWTAELNEGRKKELQEETIRNAAVIVNVLGLHVFFPRMRRNRIQVTAQPRYARRKHLRAFVSAISSATIFTQDTEASYTALSGAAWSANPLHYATEEAHQAHRLFDMIEAFDKTRGNLLSTLLDRNKERINPLRKWKDDSEDVLFF